MKVVQVSYVPESDYAYPSILVLCDNGLMFSQRISDTRNFEWVEIKPPKLEGVDEDPDALGAHKPTFDDCLREVQARMDSGVFAANPRNVTKCVYDLMTFVAKKP